MSSAGFSNTTYVSKKMSPAGICLGTNKSIPRDSWLQQAITSTKVHSP